MTETNKSISDFEELKLRSLKEDATPYGELWKPWHDLADAQDEPAKEFFIERLRDPRSRWREHCLSFIGFHYELEDNVLEMIRGMLINDVDSGVRIAAAGVLASQGQFPEKTLLHTLVHDPDRFVRECAFSDLLKLAGVPYMAVRKAVLRIRAKEITASLWQLKRILSKHKLFDKLALLNEVKN